MQLIHRAVRAFRRDGVGAVLTQGGQFARRKIEGVWFGLSTGRECPICGWTGSRFVTVNGRLDARCPKCDAKERHRLLWLYLRDELLDGAPTNLLYFAPVDGLLDRIAAHPGVTVTTCDLISDEVDVHTDITCLPFADHSFDVICCSHVLEHVPDDAAAITELHRVLRPGGRAIVMVPKKKDRLTREDLSITDPDERERRYGQPGHVRQYGTDFIDRLRAPGWNVRVERYAANVDDSVRFGLIDNHHIHVCER